MPKQYVYYYYSERDDDFAETNIKTIVTPKDFKYYQSNIFYKFFKTIVYSLLIVLVKIVLWFKGVRFKNKKVLRNLKNKKKGYFIYSNHTSYFEDAVTGQAVTFPKQTYIVCNPDATSIRGIKHLVKLLGAYPVPTYKESYLNFAKDMETLINKGKSFVIYPEAHIWPHYNRIRDFSDSSFYYPIKFNAPSFVKTTVYRKNKFGKYVMDIYFDGPFYPNEALPFNEAKRLLCKEIKETMQKRVKLHQSVENPKYKYVKINNIESVRIEKTFTKTR